MTKSKKKLAIVGAGAISLAYVKVLEECDFAELSAVADLRIDAAKATAETSGCPSFQDYKKLAADVPVDGVIICTPPATHPEIAVHFLKAGIPVLCEKPLATTQAAAKEIIDAARLSGTLVTMASKFRFVDDVIQAKSIIASGALGEIQLLENAFVAPVDMSKRWNSNPTVSGGGVWIDNGTHSVDIIRFLLGPIERVQLVTNSFNEGMPVEDNAFMFAQTKSGASVRVDLSWSFDKQLENYIQVYGTNGTLRVGWQQSKYIQSGNPNWTSFGSGYDKISAFRNNLQNFCQAIEGVEAPLISADDALASVDVVQAAYRSAEQQRWVEVVGSDEVDGAAKETATKDDLLAAK